MTTKTDTQAAFEKWLGARADDPSLPHGLMRDAFCAGVEADRQGRVPSDEEIYRMAEDARVWVPMGSGPEKERSLQALRSLITTALSRYSSGQPTVCQECGGDGAGGLHEDDCSQNSSGQPAASAETRHED